MIRKRKITNKSSIVYYLKFRIWPLPKFLREKGNKHDPFSIVYPLIFGPLSISTKEERIQYPEFLRPFSTLMLHETKIIIECLHGKKIETS